MRTKWQCGSTWTGVQLASRFARKRTLCLSMPPLPLFCLSSASSASPLRPVPLLPLLCLSSASSLPLPASPCLHASPLPLCPSTQNKKPLPPCPNLSAVKYCEDLPSDSRLGKRNLLIVKINLPWLFNGSIEHMGSRVLLFHTSW